MSARTPMGPFRLGRHFSADLPTVEAAARGGGPPAAGPTTVRGLMIAGTHSGVGKTSLALGLMGALQGQGASVAPFKVGPDYIDPMYHSRVVGRPSRNLDTWLMPVDEVRAVFARGLQAAAPAPGQTAGSPPPGTQTAVSLGGVGGAPGVVGLVEGVMGLFDGRAGAGDDCSSAQIAKLLGIPVVLVVDSSSMARSAAAIVHGFASFDPAVRVVGVILNKVASPSHARMLRESVEPVLPVLGLVPRRPELGLESRHLGLVPTVEREAVDVVLGEIVKHVEEHVDLDALLALAGHLDLPVFESPPLGGSSRRRIGVARDRAFSFYYQDNLETLEDEGATLEYFSPADGEACSDCDALYLGGGFPEVYAAELADNEPLRRLVKEMADEGRPIYAECGGYLYLGEEITYQGERHQMAGVLPLSTTLEKTRLRMGYASGRAQSPHPLSGSEFKGHLFHYSRTTGPHRPAYCITKRDEEFQEGWAGRELVASYLHLHFRGSRAVARWLAGTSESGRKRN